MYLKFALFSLLSVVAVDLLFYMGIRPFLNKFSLTKQRWFTYCYWGFTIFSLSTVLFAVYHYIYLIPPPKFARVYVSGFVFIILISKLIGVLFFAVDYLRKLIKWLISRRKLKNEPAENRISRGTFLRKAGTIAALVPFTSLSYGALFGAFNFKVRKIKVVLPNLPATFNGLRIVQISDIHSGSFISGGPLETAVALIQDLKADLVFFTGDLVNEIAEEAEPFIDIFKGVTAPLGVYSILGNHDYGDYFYRKDDVESKLKNRKKMIEIHRRMGWDLLLNDHRIIERDGHKLGLIGVENWGRSERFPKYGDIHKAIINMEHCPVNILLSHDPSHWEEKVLPHHPDIDLTLSGHTHGFQMGIEIPGFRWSPAQYLYKQWAGLYNKEGRSIYVNRGLGFIGYPGRLGIPPEITLMELSTGEA